MDLNELVTELWRAEVGAWKARECQPLVSAMERAIEGGRVPEEVIPRVALSLGRIATQIYCTAGPQGTPVVVSALRSYAALMGRDGLEVLEGYLGEHGREEIYQTVLECIRTVLRGEPPKYSAAVRRLVEDVTSFVHRLIDSKEALDERGELLCEAFVAYLLLAERADPALINRVIDLRLPSAVERIAVPLQEVADAWEGGVFASFGQTGALRDVAYRIRRLG